MRLGNLRKKKRRKKRNSKGIWDMPSICRLKQTLVTVWIHLLSLLDLVQSLFPLKRSIYVILQKQGEARTDAAHWYRCCLQGVSAQQILHQPKHWSFKILHPFTDSQFPPRFTWNHSSSVVGKTFLNYFFYPWFLSSLPWNLSSLANF